MSDTQSKTLWHVLFGVLLEELLPPVGISVQKEFPLLSQSPKADILILKREKGQWTEEQLSRLPDGIRESYASNILLEFKYTESVDENTFEQALGYHSLYKRAQKLTNQEVQTFIISGKQTRAKRLEQWGYVKTDWKGVYHNPDNWLLQKMPLLSLNELSDEPHNAWVKCFASHKLEKKKAFEILKGATSSSLSVMLERVLAGLWQFWFVQKGDDMKSTLTEEQLKQMNEMWGETFLSRLTVEDMLERFSREEILAHLTPAERLAGLKPAERFVGLKPADRLAGLKPAERFVGLKPAEIFAGLKPQELEEIEKLIKKRKQKR
jgi:hypothetical protein